MTDIDRGFIEQLSKTLDVPQLVICNMLQEELDNADDIAELELFKRSMLCDFDGVVGMYENMAKVRGENVLTLIENVLIYSLKNEDYRAALQLEVVKNYFIG